MKGTVDNSTYFKRVGTAKGACIEEFVKSKKGIKVVYDVGCNNGALSYPLQVDLGLKVRGIDLSETLNTPKDYDFGLVDIADDNIIFFNDCTLFLSLYHHLLWAIGLERADDIFYKLLFRTKYLIFDVGNISETTRKRYPWFKTQKKYFQSEKELLDHFDVPYTKIGGWNIGGGHRSVVVFDSKDLIDRLVVEETYHRMRKRTDQKKGLFKHDTDHPDLFKDIVYRKLTHNGRTYFSKNRKIKSQEKKEIENIQCAYEHIDKKSLIRFYGVSKKYGLIYEWIEGFRYVGKQPLQCGDVTLKAVDLIILDGVMKYIDFET